MDIHGLAYIVDENVLKGSKIPGILHAAHYLGLLNREIVLLQVDLNSTPHHMVVENLSRRERPFH